jgi:hypothetical protein
MNNYLKTVENEAKIDSYMKKDIRGMGMEKETPLYPLLILVHHPAPPRRLAYLGSAFTYHTGRRKIRREGRD